MDIRPTVIEMDEISLIIGKIQSFRCSLKRVASDKALFIGFGEIMAGKTNAHAKIEIVIYRSAWRFVCNKRVLCGSNDFIEDIEAKIKNIAIESLQSIKQTSVFDIQIQLSKSIYLEVFSMISEDDETIEIFLPSKGILTFNPSSGWRLGRSDQSWI